MCDLYDCLMTLGSITCHQLGSRSFFITGLKLPFCARDTGIYFAFLLTFLLLLILKRHKRDAPPTVKSAVFMAFLMLPMMLDGITSYIGIRQTNNNIRFITGLIFGSCLAYLVMTIIIFKISGLASNPLIKSSSEIIPILSLVIFIGFLVYYVLGNYLFASIIPIFGQHFLIFVVIYSVLKRVAANKKTVTILSSTAIYILFISFIYFFSKLIKSLM